MPQRLFSEEPHFVQKDVKEWITGNKVVIFSKFFCRYCSKAKELLHDIEPKPKIIETTTLGADKE